MKNIITSAVILLAETDKPDKYLFGAYDDDGKATSFLSLPEDHGVFIKLLIGQQTIMGANTLKATPDTFPDGGRICVTHHPEAIKLPAIAAGDIESAIEIAKERAEKREENKVYVIGGANLMKQCLEKGILDEIELTLTYGYKKEVENPVYLEFNLNDWRVVGDSGILTSAASEPIDLKYRFLTIKRRG